MKKGITPTILILTLSAIACCVWFLNKLHRDYTRMVNAAPKAFVVAVETDRLKALRKEIAADQWRVVGVGDVAAYNEVFGLIGVAPSIEGMARFLGHPLPAFDWFDMKQNKRNVVIAMLKTLHCPHGTDGMFHLNDSRQAGVIFLQENVVEFHVNTNAGLLSGSLVKKPAGNDEHPGLSRNYPDL